MQNTEEIRLIEEKVQQFSPKIDLLRDQMGKIIIGQKNLIHSLLIALFSDGHILLEGLPGLAKTLAIKSLANCLDAKFSRIQFTPDLLPADVIGTMIYQQKLDDFIVKKGPIFSNLVLADEINRAPAKVQSALLEAMQERQVTIGDDSYKLDNPFLVMATQNPLDQEGTYSLPEAQLDRFLLKVKVDYPNEEEELLIIRQPYLKDTLKQKGDFNLREVLNAREVVKNIYMEESIEKYILKIVFSTRNPSNFSLKKMAPLMSYGISPRGSLGLSIAARANAFLSGRTFVIPEDIQNVALDVLRHRIGLTYEAESENYTPDQVLLEIMKIVSVP